MLHFVLLLDCFTLGKGGMLLHEVVKETFCAITRSMDVFYRVKVLGELLSRTSPAENPYQGVTAHDIQ
jgi:hypothetical protein